MTDVSRKSLIDVHVHLAAFPTERNGCRMSRSFRKSFAVKLVRWKLGLSGDDMEAINETYLQRLVSDLRASRCVERAVLLALDGVYDERGDFDENKTHMMMDNAHVKSVCDRYPDLFLFGASVNPRRRDALDELDRVIAAGARLIKILPPAQGFDPMDKQFIPFYRKLAAARVPILSHIGYEFTVTSTHQSVGFPDRLRNALEEGVTVIGAHAGSSAVFFQGKFEKMLHELMDRYPNFVLDLSATTLPNRASILWKLQRRPEWFDRLLFATDYPLSAYATPFLGRIPLGEQTRLWRERNIFDKQVGVLNALNVRFNPALARQLLKVEDHARPR